MKPVITVKNVKYSALASEETLYYKCTVYVDGKKFAFAESGGRGGCVNFFNAVKNAGDAWAPIEKLDKEIGDSYPEITYDLGKGRTGSYKESFESLVNGAVSDFLSKRDMKRAMKKEVVFVNGDNMYSVPAPNGIGDVVKATVYLSKKYPDAIVLNSLSEEKAFAEWKKVTEA